MLIPDFLDFLFSVNVCKILFYSAILKALFRFTNGLFQYLKILLRTGKRDHTIIPLALFSQEVVFTRVLFTLTFSVLYVAHAFLRDEVAVSCKTIVKFVFQFSFSYCLNIFTLLDVNHAFLNLLVVWSSLTNIVVSILL